MDTRIPNNCLWACALVFFSATALLAATPAVQTLPLAEGRDAYEPAAAFGQDVFLVAFKSGHLAPGDLRQGLEYAGDIVACRVNLSAEVLDAKPLVICSAPDLQERPRIAFGGGVFLIVWQDLRNEKDWDVYAARLTPEGKLLDPNGFVVSGGPHNQALPDVAWDGKAFQVVWQDYRCGDRYEIYGARVSPQGEVLEPEGQLFVTEQPPYSRINPVLAAPPRGGKLLLFWLGGARVIGQKVPCAGCHLVNNGRASAEPTFTNTDVQTTPGSSAGHLPFPATAASGPRSFLVAWTTNAPYGRGNAPNDAHAALFALDGTLEKKLLLAVDQQRTEQAARTRNPSAAWDGSAFVVAWDQIAGEAQEGLARWPVETVFCARVAEDGNVADRQHVAGTAAGPAIKPAVASDAAGTTLIVFEQHPDSAETPIAIGLKMFSP